MEPYAKQLAETEHIRVGHRKIDPINQFNPHIKQLKWPKNEKGSKKETERHPTEYQQRNTDALDSCHIVDKSLVRDLFAGIGQPPVELEADNLPAFAGTMHINRYRDNHSVGADNQTVNQARIKILDKLKDAKDIRTKRGAWESAKNFILGLYEDEPCLQKLAEMIATYAETQAGL